MADETITTEILSTGVDAEVIARLARDGVPPHVEHVGDYREAATAALFFGAGPDGHRLVHVEDLEKRGPLPARKRGTVKVDTPEALRTYAERHLDEETSTLWAEIDQGRVTVVLNDHSSLQYAGWADHRAVLQLRRSDEWKAWTSLAGEWATQHDLALFLEEHLQDIAEPDGSTLLEVTETFHATSDATFTSTRRMADGSQHLVWKEDVNATAGRGQQASIPTDLVLHLRPWIGVDPVPVAGKFRFRVRDGQLRLRVDLLRTDEASRDAVEQAAIEVAEHLTLPVIEGTPPSPRL